MKMKDQTGSKSLFEGLSKPEAEALKKGPTVKRSAEAANVFNQLMSDANKEIDS
jgi:hypothetical protein